MPAGQTAHRIIGVDLLRAASIAAVLANHWLVWIPAGWPETSSRAARAVHALFENGGYGVYVFFVVSGFLITRTTMSREPDLFRLSAAAFYVRRAARIVPLLLASLALGVLLLAFASTSDPLFRSMFGTPSAMTWPFWASVASFTFNWLLAFQPHAPIGLHWSILWSLSVEEQFYALFPIAIILSRNIERLAKLLLSAIAVSVTSEIAQRLAAADWSLAATNSLNAVGPLACGALCALFGRRLALPRALRPALAALGAALLLAAFASADFYLAMIAIMAGASIVVLAVDAEGVWSSPLWRPLARVGELTYGMYLLHPFVLYLAAPYLTPLGLLPGFALYVLATALFAQAVYTLFERPANAWIRQTLLGGARRRAPRPA